MRAGRFDDAIKVLNDGLPRFDEPTRRTALRALGRAYLGRGDRAAAGDSFVSAGDFLVARPVVANALDVQRISDRRQPRKLRWQALPKGCGRAIPIRYLRSQRVPIAAMIRVSNCPAGPTNGSPMRSSSAPGASPTKHSSGSTGPTPKTVCVRVLAS